MPILTHGSDLTLSPTLTPLVRAANGTVRSALDQLGRAGFAGVQLDATLPGLRPRELDARARKDLLALLNRRNVRATGIDLFIPRRHFTSPDHSDRAMSAALAAVTLAADLGRLPLSLALPVKTMPPELRAALVEAADGHGIRLAIHAEDQLDALEAWVTEVDLPTLGAAIDPAAVLARGQDPAQVVQRFGKRLAVARLSDVERGTSDDEPGEATEAVRVSAGRGDLDLIPYRVAVDLAGHRAGPVVLDLRGLANPLNAAVAAKHAWDSAAFTV